MPAALDLDWALQKGVRVWMKNGTFVDFDDGFCAHGEITPLGPILHVTGPSGTLATFHHWASARWSDKGIGNTGDSYMCGDGIQSHRNAPFTNLKTAVQVHTVADLIRQLSRVPSSLPVQREFSKDGIDLVIFNSGSPIEHLTFENLGEWTED